MADEQKPTPDLGAVDRQMAVDDGGAAFPRPTGARSNSAADPSWRIESAGGMSLRDWFVGQAIAGGHGVLDSFEIADDAIRIRKGDR